MKNDFFFATAYTHVFFFVVIHVQQKKTHLNNDGGGGGGGGGHTFVIKLIKKSHVFYFLFDTHIHTRAGHFSKNEMTNQEIEIEKFKEKLLL